MVKQNPFQLLEHGKAICGKKFPRFVECWNWLFSFFVGVRGDADLDPQNGHITRDDSGAFPVFRFVNANFGSGGVIADGCFNIVEIFGLTVSFDKCYYMIGGKFYTLGTSIASVGIVSSNPIVALRINVETPQQGTTGPSAELINTNIGELTTGNPDYYTIPLYLFKVDGSTCAVDTDFRNIPSASMYEF